jgi:hypothetical protein
MGHLWSNPAEFICEPPMSDETAAQVSAMPDRLSVDPDSPFYSADILSRGVGIRFKGEEKHNVEEYCVSEGWVRLSVGNKVDRRGKALTIKLQGLVEPYMRDEG